MDKNLVIAIVLGALIIIAGIQAVQLFSFKTSLGTMSVGGAAVSSGNGAALPSNLQNLPQMVGGC